MTFDTFTFFLNSKLGEIFVGMFEFLGREEEHRSRRIIDSFQSNFSAFPFDFSTTFNIVSFCFWHLLQYNLHFLHFFFSSIQKKTGRGHVCLKRVKNIRNKSITLKNVLSLLITIIGKRTFWRQHQKAQEYSVEIYFILKRGVTNLRLQDKFLLNSTNFLSFLFTFLERFSQRVFFSLFVCSCFHLLLLLGPNLCKKKFNWCL